MKKNKILEDVKKMLALKFDDLTAERIIYNAYNKLNLILEENKNEDKALEFMDWCWSKRAIPKAKAMQSLCKLPGMYKKMPAIFKKVTLSSFSEKQGFKLKFYDMGKHRCKFDMQKCLYCEICKKYNCPELTQIFCHTDDVTDGNIHPKLKWNRTKTMGEGGDICDFDLYVIE